MASGQEVVSFAQQFVGKIPYVLGSSVYATAQHKSADCSSFTQYVFTTFHIDLPRMADQQFRATMTGGAVYSPGNGMYAQGQTVNIDHLDLGDLIFFGGWNTPTNPPGFMGIQHVAIYAGGGKIIEENVPNVQLTNLSAYKGHTLTASRVNGVNDVVNLTPVGTVTVDTDSITQCILPDGITLVPAPLGQTIPAYGRSVVTGPHPGPAFLIVVGGKMVSILERNTTGNTVPVEAVTGSQVYKLELDVVNGIPSVKLT